MNFNAWVWAGIASILCAGAAVAQPARVAAIGDSLTDEYSEQWYGSYAKSWTQVLVDTGRIDMGPVAFGHAASNYWDEPRRTGYQNNWARYSETTEYALASGQHVGAAESVSSGRSDYVILFIGGNDYSAWSYGTYDEIYYGRWTPLQVQEFNEQRLTNFRTMLDALAPTGARIVLSSVPDFSFMPWVWQVHGVPLGRERVAIVMAAFRDQVKALAKQRGVVFLDMFRLMQDIYGPDPVARNTLYVGNVPIALHQGQQQPAAGFVEDIAHPHTVIQAILARAFVTALNGGFTAGIPDMNEANILAAAGIPYGGSDTLGGILAPMSTYVQNFGCTADFNLDHVVGIQDIFDYLEAYFVSDPKADLNSSGFAEVGDLFVFLTSYFASCP